MQHTHDLSAEGVKADKVKGKRLTILSISKYGLVLFLCCALFLCSFFSFLFIQIFPNCYWCYISIFDGLVTCIHTNYVHLGTAYIDTANPAVDLCGEINPSEIK